MATKTIEERSELRKTMFPILALVILLINSLHVQAQTQIKATPLDSIYQLNGVVLTGAVTTVTPSYISFVLAENNEEYTIERKEVQKIVYKTGRIEVFNKSVFEVLEDSMWEAVWLADKKNQVSDLYVLGEIEASSSASERSATAAKNGAIIRLKKKAANMNGTVVLVTKRQNTGGYGEFPGYYISGIVYGPEPPVISGSDQDI